MIERVLIVGYGSIGRRHLRLVRRLLPKSDIRVLIRTVIADEIKGANGIFTNVEDACKFNPQISVIANPAPFHLSMAKKMLHVGSHIFMEKPLANNLDLEGIINLFDICNGNDSIFFMAYNLRFMKSLQYFRERICEGRIGKVISLRCEAGSYLPDWRPDKDYRKSVTADHSLGGGVLLELSHELDYLQWIFGSIDWVMSVLGHQSSLEINVEDVAHIILGFESGCDETQLIGTISLDCMRRDPTRLCVAIGELGSLRWNGVSGDVDEFDPSIGSWKRIYHERIHKDDTYLAEWEHFISCVNGDSTPIISMMDGLRVMETIEAIRKSSNSKKREYCLYSQDW